MSQDRKDNNGKSGGYTRREFTRALALGGVALAGGSQAQPAAGTAPSAPQAPAVVKRKRPNILLIMSDQERGWPDLPGGLGLNAH
ncbi:MAG: hypothetical protein JWR07_4306, partial [Nevskia sp.]|nr:hypothetical protein [Nevskia sp.]